MIEIQKKISKYFQVMLELGCKYYYNLLYSLCIRIVVVREVAYFAEILMPKIHEKPFGF